MFLLFIWGSPLVETDWTLNHLWQYESECTVCMEKQCITKRELLFWEDTFPVHSPTVNLLLNSLKCNKIYTAFCISILVHSTYSGSHVGSVSDATTQSIVGSVPTVSMDCRALSPGNACAGNANAFVLSARYTVGCTTIIYFWFFDGYCFVMLPLHAWPFFLSCVCSIRALEVEPSCSRDHTMTFQKHLMTHAWASR